MEVCVIRAQKLCQTGTRRTVFVVGFMASMVLVLHSFRLHSRHSLVSTFPSAEVPEPVSTSSVHETTSSMSMMIGRFSLLSELQNLTNQSVTVKESENSELLNMGGEIGSKEMRKDSEEDDGTDNDIDLDEDGNADEEFSFDLGDGNVLRKARDPVGGFITLEEVVEPKKSHIEKVSELGDGISDGVGDLNLTLPTLEQVNSGGKEPLYVRNEYTPLASDINKHLERASIANSSNYIINAGSNASLPGQQTTKIVPTSTKQVIETLGNNGTSVPWHSRAASGGNFSVARIASSRRKKGGPPPVYISEMNSILARNHASHHAMRPRWSSVRDKQMLAIKAQIDNAPVVKHDRELYAPAFRNISTFKRSYELMERTLKVYVYKEGQKPMFHQPILKGIYASEGWFMKLMEGNRRYIVRDPRKAHLYYIPFSSRLLQFALYVRNRETLKRCIQDYVDTIAAKYPFWNRTGGADHFIVACHDWAPFETRHTMPNAIRALCVADVHSGFCLGRDVSLPETLVRFGRNPLKDIGGRPANQRPTLAFYAGNLHGSLRPKLLQHWENKDPDMKILGPMPAEPGTKVKYIQHMKTSKYCICPRGYEVNSPRVVESIFYECVPVIISDNYVPPFFEVLNWEAFSVIIPEKDLPRLKNILLSIPEGKYFELQLGVKKVQKHFLWHSKPVKYDLFHMILHSIWYNRVYEVRTR